MLTNNLRTHILILTDGRNINITKDQYTTIKLKMDDPGSKYSDSLTIKDADTKYMLFDGKMGAIKEFKEIKRDSSLGEKRRVCSYGGRHEIIGFPDNCDCEFTFGCSGLKFKDELKEMGYNVFYDRDITESMRQEYRAKYI